MRYHLNNSRNFILIYVIEDPIILRFHSIVIIYSPTDHVWSVDISTGGAALISVNMLSLSEHDLSAPALIMWYWLTCRSSAVSKSQFSRRQLYCFQLRNFPRVFPRLEQSGFQVNLVAEMLIYFSNACSRNCTFVRISNYVNMISTCLWTLELLWASATCNI